MGGNALKDVVTRRYEREEYLKAEKEVLARVRKVLTDSRSDAIPAYRTKPSFGDMDIVIEHLESKIEIEKHFNNWGVKEVSKNGNVWSIHYNDLQVDLIFSKKEYYDSTLNYFSYNDIGNLIGGISRSFGIKLGHKGLNYELKEKENVIKDLNITNDYYEALEFLGYDSERFKKGFDDLNDMFEYVISSEFFNPTVYDLATRSNDARTRDAKRPNYIKFLEFLEKKQFEISNPVNKDEILERLFKSFPKFKENYNDSIESIKTKAIIKEKFNGKIISSITNYSGVNLGLFYIYLEKENSKINNFKELIKNMDEKEIELFIKVKNKEYDQNLGFKNFSSPKLIKIFLTENLGFDEEKLVNFKKIFNEYNMIKKSKEIQEPIAGINNGTSYVFNLNTYVSLINEHYNLNLKVEKIKDFTKEFKINRYIVINSEEDLENTFENLIKSRSIYKEKTNSKKIKKQLPTGNINNLIQENTSKSILSFDMEMYEKDHTKITEIGFSFLKNSIQENRHFIISEHYDLKNGKFIADNKDNFNFGKSEILPLNEVVKIVSKKINETDFIVGNSIMDDLKRIFPAHSLFLFSKKVINTEKIINLIDKEKKQPLSIKKSLEFFNIDYDNLHNAGNDAYYSLEVVKKTIESLNENKQKLKSSKI